MIIYQCMLIKFQTWKWTYILLGSGIVVCPKSIIESYGTCPSSSRKLDLLACILSFEFFILDPSTCMPEPCWKFD
jgi:hypothetical protein